MLCCACLVQDLPATMLRRTTRILIVAALMFSIGLHWIALQSVAWAGMLVTYTAQEGSLLTGMSQTFDAAHPCPLCCAIKKGRQSEKRETKQTDQKQKIDLALTFPGRVILTPPSPTLSPPLPDFPHVIARRAKPPARRHEAAAVTFLWVEYHRRTHRVNSQACVCTHHSAPPCPARTLMA